MSTTLDTAGGLTEGRIDVTGRSIREVREFALEVAGEVHVERRGGKTYVVAE
ncbi:MAG: hypothetical protein ABEI75_05310 [Halobaculum sp.]